MSDCKRESWLNVRVTDREYAEIIEHAKRRGLNVSDHVREIMIKLARGQLKLDEPSQTMMF